MKNYASTEKEGGYYLNHRNGWIPAYSFLITYITLRKGRDDDLRPYFRNRLIEPNGTCAVKS
jgi:hypothetical protein